MEHTFEWGPLTEEDRSAYINLVRAVGWAASADPNGWEWAYHARQFRLFTGIGRLYGHRHEGRLISCIGIFPFGHAYASVGMVMVDPHFQRNGLGQRLMRFLLVQEQGQLKGTALFLIATAMGEPLYKKFGFHTVESLHRLELAAGQGKSIASPNEKTTPFAEQDVADLLAFDLQVLGMDRRHFYRQLFQNDTPAFLIRNPDTNALEAFGFGVKRGETLVIGPFLATNTADAMQILHHLRNTWPGPIRINVPDHQTAFLHELHQLGATEINRSPLMIRNASTLPGRRSLLFSIADPALG